MVVFAVSGITGQVGSAVARTLLAVAGTFSQILGRPVGIEAVPRAEGGVTELFDVRVLPGVRRPTATGFLTDEIHRAFSVEVDCLVIALD